MWIVKEQSKHTPMGKQVSPVMETQSGASACRDLLQTSFDRDKKPEEEPKHYFIVQHIKRGSKKS